MEFHTKKAPQFAEPFHFYAFYLFPMMPIFRATRSELVT